MISVIMVQHNHAALTRAAVASLRRHHTSGFEVLVVDNGSTEQGIRDATGRIPGCRVIFHESNAGFGTANNIGAREARGEILLFLNNDTIVRDEFLGRVEEYFARTPVCGAAGLRLCNQDGSVQISAGKSPGILSEWRMRRGVDPYRGSESPERDWVTGAAMAVRRAVFETIGGFDERYFMYFEDADLCARIRHAGYRIHALATPALEHLGGGSQPRGFPPEIQREYRRSQLMYYGGHAPLIDNILLRAYLIARFLPGAIAGKKESRAIASGILRMAAGRIYEARH